MSGPSRFTQANVARALKGAKEAGLEVERFEIDRDGKIIVQVGNSKNAATTKPFDDNDFGD